MDWCILECLRKSQVCIGSSGYSLANGPPASNGPLFMPNTLLMQDLARNAFDQYRDEDEASRPVLISIKNGSVCNHTRAGDTDTVLQGPFFPRPSCSSIKILHCFHYNRFIR